MTHYEKKSLILFLLTYLGSSLLLMLTIAFLVFQLQKTMVLQNIESHMRAESARIVGEITHAHMNQKTIDDVELKSAYEISLWDKQGKKIYGTSHVLKEGGTFYENMGKLYLVDKGTYGHLGVDRVVIVFENLDQEIGNLQTKIITLFFLSFLFIVVMAFVLGKMFLKPVHDEVQRLDLFIKDSTHELNTPISALLMSVNSIQKSGVTDKKLSRIYAASKRVEILYQDLTYLFLQNLKSEEKALIHLDELIRERVDFLWEISQDKGISFTQNLSPKTLYADKESITRLVDNLLGNAIKYAPKHGEVDVLLTDEYLQVSNTGDLIPDEKIELLTTRYYRHDASKKGFGIGLDIVKSVCRKYHFSLKIEVREPSFNIFRIHFH